MKRITDIGFLALTVAAVLVLLGTVNTVCAATITVSSTADGGPGTLRNALGGAFDNDTIVFSLSPPATITLTNGELLVTKSLKIIGLGPTNLAIDGHAASRVFHILGGLDVKISGLTITNGYAASSSSFNSDKGGGIYNDRSTLTISNCTLGGNSADYNGGGIYNDGAGTAQAKATVIGTTFSANGANYGGGVYNDHGTLTISNCTLSGNIAYYGGGIYNNGRTDGTATATVITSTITANTAWYSGGGIYNYALTSSGSATLKVSACTFSANLGYSSVGGIFNVSYGNASLEIGGTILNAGASGRNIGNDTGVVISVGYNLSSDNGGGYLTAVGDQINTNPMLGPLQNNGGPTFTHTLLPGSPAIDTGDPGFTSPPDFDQRGPGFPRVVNGRIDIGAFEYTPLLIIALEPIGDNLRLRFTGSIPGHMYEIQSRTDMTFGTWQSIPGNIPGNGGVTNGTVSNAFNQTQQFYRIHQLP